MTIAITGASGHLGRLVADELIARVPAADLVLITRSPDSLKAFVDRGVQVRRGDFDDPAGLTQALAGVERLLLISSDLDTSRLPQHRNAVAAATTAGVRSVAYTSFLNPSPANPAEVIPDHVGTEETLRASGLAWTFLRHSYYAENELHNAMAALETGLLFNNAAAGRISYVARADCAAVAASVLVGDGHDHQAYDITGPAGLNAEELASLFAEIGGRSVRTVTVDDPTMVANLIQAGLPRQAAELIASFGRSAHQGYLATVTPTVADLTGQPATSLREVLQKNRDELVAAADRRAA